MKTKVYWPTFCALLVCVILLSGCVTDVSRDPPHNKLVGTEWKLKTDVYVIEFNGSWNDLIIYPCTKFFSGSLPDFDMTYKEENIGRSYNGRKVVAGYKKGTVFKIVRVLKKTEIEMGATWIPVMLPVDACSRIKELDGYYLYWRVLGKGILDPEYAEPVLK